VFKGERAGIERIDRVEHEVVVRFDGGPVKYGNSELDDCSW
jgi:hypothetical protein